jgi:hypothetical protein
LEIGFEWRYSRFFAGGINPFIIIMMDIAEDSAGMT